MQLFGANISEKLVSFFLNFEGKEREIEFLNKELEAACGIVDFFKNKTELINFYKKIVSKNNRKIRKNRTEFGDFQTNSILSENVCKFLLEKNISPEIVIEPTCGKGNFVLASLKIFKNLKEIYAVEIYKSYVWQTKFNVLEFFLENQNENKPKIKIFNFDFFKFKIEKKLELKNKNILILGNPPWVTSSTLSSLNSKNIPKKSNLKKHNGIEAITGKGNFDIGECIILRLLNSFSGQNGNLAFLVKNSVIKNLLDIQKNLDFPLGEIEKYTINSKKEFDVTVGASLLLCNLNKAKTLICKEIDFYTREEKQEFGWYENKFVSNIELYKKAKFIDGKSPFVWRQGIKHDASEIMEFEDRIDFFENKIGQKFELENNLVYGILKSSDLKENTINHTRKYTIITQKKIGEQTNYIKEELPKTYSYLLENIKYFTKRKSAIYRGKPQFSIFGIGEYSFMPFKVAISGMYKTTKFSLIEPFDNKTIMLDDTCYFLGFEKKEFAQITQFLLNKEETQNFIKSISFADSKRKITKELLMRIDLMKIAKNISFEEVKNFNNTIKQNVWLSFLNFLK